MSSVSISDVLGRYQEQYPTVPWGEIGQQLIAREDGIADYLRLAGQQFGLYPQIVAEVLAEVEMGSPIEAAQREMIRAQFIELMEAFRRAQEGGTPPPMP